MKLTLTFHVLTNGLISQSPALLDCDPEATRYLAGQLLALARCTYPDSASGDPLMQRTAMALEELAEWLIAHAERDLIAAADAWADRVYVTIGDAVATGLPADKIFAEVHRSNLTKSWSETVGGKAVKGRGYERPKIAGILNERDAKPD